VYLAPAEFIDSGHPVVTAKAGELCASIGSRRDAARAVFYFVRDLRYEGGDFEDLEIYRASSVLAGGHGYCVGKAALCTALARVAGIPARLGFSPTFDPEACRRAGVPPLDFDGEHDALLQSFDAPGATMAYLKPHGFFHDVPARFLAAEMQRLYPFAADHGITRFQAASKA
jgi:transglutaminase-like putative cysteine protease